MALAWPVGPPSERVGTGLPAGWNIAVGFNQEYWLGVHTGIDLNMNGLPESDYGQECYAVARGVVTWSGKIAGTWGYVILIHHPHLGLWSQYAHLSGHFVGVGQVVQQGQRIGLLGNADGQLSAHLHHELRQSDIFAGRWPSGKTRSKSAATHAYVLQNYVDPVGRLGA